MIPTPWTQRRLLVPRWRSLALTLDTGELAAPPRVRDPHTERSISPDLLDKLMQWRLDPGLIAAGELVGAALVEAQESEAVGAARLLLSPDSTATAPLRRLAALGCEPALRQAGKPIGRWRRASIPKCLLSKQVSARFEIGISPFRPWDLHQRASINYWRMSCRAPWSPTRRKH